jgi:hypothetical protein
LANSSDYGLGGVAWFLSYWLLTAVNRCWPPEWSRLFVGLGWTGVHSVGDMSTDHSNCSNCSSILTPSDFIWCWGDLDGGHSESVSRGARLAVWPQLGHLAMPAEHSIVIIQ